MKNFLFFINHNDISDENVTIVGESVHKIRNVLRYKKGDVLNLLLPPSKENCGKKITGTITEINDMQVVVKIDKMEDTNSASLFVTLYLSLIKGKNFELALQKATELGVDKIVPVVAERSVVKISDTDAPKKKARWSAILIEAAEQCKRNTIPIITDIVRVTELSKLHDDSEIKILCDENSAETISGYLKGREKPLSISAVVGPEGSFTKNEVAALNKLGFKSVSLSKTIFRAETVPIILLSIFNFEFCR